MRVVDKLLKHAAASVYMQVRKKKEEKKKALYSNPLSTTPLFVEKKKDNTDIIYNLSGHSAGSLWRFSGSFHRKWKRAFFPRHFMPDNLRSHNL